MDKFHLDIDSSGIEGRFNSPVHPHILQKGLELGFDLAMYRSKHSNLKALERSDLIFVVDSQQLRRFEKTYSHLMKKVYHIYDFGRDGEYERQDIEDPSHKDVEEEFEDFFQIAISETERVWEYIKGVYLKSEAEGTEFTSALFEKKGHSPQEFKHRYNFFTKRLFPICPYCQSKRIRRVKRKGYFQKKVWPRFSGYPYHCGHCNRDVILFIGSDIPSKRRSDEKRRKWESFMQEEEIARTRNHTAEQD
jgi:protein-tyrosine-phosphatase